MKATEQYFPAVLFIMLYKVVLTFESVDEILKWDHLNESYWAIILFTKITSMPFHLLKKQFWNLTIKFQAAFKLNRCIHYFQFAENKLQTF